MLISTRSLNGALYVKKERVGKGAKEERKEWRRYEIECIAERVNEKGMARLFQA